MADIGRVGELRHGVLGMADAVAESIALLALVLASSFATSLVAGNAGPAAPLAYVVAGIAAVLILLFIILAKGGNSGISLQPFNPGRLPSLHGLFLATVFAFTGFIGFEAAAVLGEEAAQPLHAIPRAILAAVLIGVVYFVFLTWVMSLGYGVANAGKWAQDPTALDTLARRYGGTGLAVVIDVAVVVDAFVAALAGIQLTSRTIFAMGRDGGMPRIFAWTHPRFKTPWVGIAAALLLTLVLVLWLPGHAFDPLTYFGFMATTASLGILFVYMLIALAGMIFFWRTRAGGITVSSLLLDILVPLGAIVICGLTMYWSVVPLPPYPISLAPDIAAAWFVIGLLLLVWLNVKSPQRVRSFGRLLGEGEPGSTPVTERQS